jgi:sensor domain CHASE-containing protein
VVSTSTKMVTSIETIIVEIHNTLKALFESWELTPKMKKQEWLDTSMNNIKFSDIVSFNIW